MPPKQRAWLLARAWIPILAASAILLAPPGTNLRSSYTARWLAAALILVAAAGRRDRRVAIAAVMLSGAGGLFMAGDNAQRMLFAGASPARWVYVAGGLVVAAVSARPLLWRSHDRFDPVWVVAIQLAIGIVAYWLYYQLSGLALDPNSYQQESLTHAAGIELALIALALGAIGVGVSRTWRPAVKRLGWTGLQLWHVALAVVTAAALGLSNLPLGLLMTHFMPGSEDAILKIFERVFTGVPAWSLPLIAVMAGVGEETMFRGALQPRFGIFATAVLFALIHVQYGATLITLWVFVHGVAYGLLRRHLNTSTAVLAHAAYDFSAFLHGAGLVAYFLVALAAMLYLVQLAARDPRRVRSYLSPRWTSPPSSTD